MDLKAAIFKYSLQHGFMLYHGLFAPYSKVNKLQAKQVKLACFAFIVHIHVIYTFSENRGAPGHSSRSVCNICIPYIN